VLLVLITLMLVSILSKPASQTAQTGEELTDLLEGKGSLTCDIKCFECCNREKTNPAGPSVACSGLHAPCKCECA